MGARVLLFVLLFCSSLLARLINGKFRPRSSSTLLWLYLNLTGRNTSTKSILQSFFFFFFVKIVCYSGASPRPPDRTVRHYILQTSGLFTALYSDETSRFQLATLAPLCEVISRADKRAARGGSKGTNYPWCLDGWQHGQQQRANLCREIHLSEARLQARKGSQSQRRRVRCL